MLFFNFIYKALATATVLTEEGMAIHPVFLPGESPWTEEPGGLQSMGSQ